MRRIISFFIFFPGKGIWTRVSNSAAVHDEQEGMHSQPRKNPVVILCMLPICLYPLLKKRGHEEPAFLKDMFVILKIYIYLTTSEMNLSSLHLYICSSESEIINKFNINLSIDKLIKNKSCVALRQMPAAVIQGWLCIGLKHFENL